MGGKAKDGQNGLRDLGRPVIIGLVATLGFYGLIYSGGLRHDLVLRYLAGHPIEYAEVCMFFVGMSVLVMRGANILGQWSRFGSVQLAPPPEGGQPSDAAADLLASLYQLPAAARKTYLVRRWMDAIEYVSRKDSADQLDDELRYLADMDAGRMHEGYGLVRIIIWATPMLGFLGTVMGITLALGDLSPEALVNSPKEAMEGLLGGLSVAFDTTAVALTLSILLMFTQFLVGQFEHQLLAAVDQRTGAELVGRFRQWGTGRDPHLASVHRMSHTVIEACEQLVERQAGLWNEALQQTFAQMASWWKDSRDEMVESASTQVSQTIRTHAEQVEQCEAERRRELILWHEQLQQVTTIGADRFEQQQASLERQTQTLERLAQQAHDVLGLENALRKNLDSLAESHHFAETVMSLSAAIHLLNTRLGKAAESSAAPSSSDMGHAA